MHATESPNGLHELVPSQPMNMLFRLYADEETVALLSETRYVHQLVRVEQAVAAVQGELGVIPSDVSTGVVEALLHVRVNEQRLWEESKVVGYPVLPLIRQIDEQLAEHLRGYLHWGLTTQDVMDTALVLQMREVVGRQCQLLCACGDALSVLSHTWAAAVGPARTHAQHAVPTTIGARFAVFLAQIAELSRDLVDARDGAATVSLHGAGGTSAAIGPAAGEVRRRVAQRLSLRHTDVPWHVARQSLVRLTGVQASLAAVCARLAKEVIDLSRDEIREVSEASGHLRGASSTMPQKSNPIDAEAIIGLSWTCTTNYIGMLRALEAGHERAAGEWQIEWAALPTVLVSCSSALATSARMSAGLQVDPAQARKNVEVNGGAILAEAYMIQLAATVGREQAHELVYAAVRDSSARKVSLHEAMAALGEGVGTTVVEIRPEDYIGDAESICRSAELSWAEARTGLNAATGGS